MADRTSATRPTAKMIRLHHRLRGVMGEPTDLFVFDASDSSRPLHLPLLHVPTWAADEHCDVTGLNTLGMSERQMPGADAFVELHLGFRGHLDKGQRLDLARMLADVAEYPFENGLKLDHWEIIPEVSRIPVFAGCRHLLLHPRLAEGGIDRLEDEDGPVKLIYVVPITPYERHLLTAHGRSEFLRHVEEEDVDLLSDRHDPPGWDTSP